MYFPFVLYGIKMGKENIVSKYIFIIKLGESVGPYNLCEKLTNYKNRAASDINIFFYIFHNKKH
ncbi:hypothetical protein BKK39_07285 [Bacillus cereus]|nr:hypothetical protein BKK39_07285 [Bacillus cereus]